jgi:hypothetical protein
MPENHSETITALVQEYLTDALAEKTKLKNFSDAIDKKQKTLIARTKGLIAQITATEEFLQNYVQENSISILEKIVELGVHIKLFNEHTIKPRKQLSNTIEIDPMERFIQGLKEALEARIAELLNLQTQMQDLQEANQRLGAEKTALVDEKAALVDEKAALGAEKTALEARIAELLNLQTQMQDLQEANQRLGAEKTALVDEKAALGAEKTALEARIAELEELNAGLQLPDELLESEPLLEGLNTDLQLLDGLTALKKRLQNAIADLQFLHGLTEFKDNLDKKTPTEDDKLQSIVEAAVTAAAKPLKLQKATEELEEELSKSLKELQKQLEQYKKAKDDRKIDLKNQLDTKIPAILGQITELKNKLDKLQQDLGNQNYTDGQHVERTGNLAILESYLVSLQTTVNSGTALSTDNMLPNKDHKRTLRETVDKELAKKPKNTPVYIYYIQVRSLVDNAKTQKQLASLEAIINPTNQGTSLQGNSSQPEFNFIGRFSELAAYQGTCLDLSFLDKKRRYASTFTEEQKREIALTKFIKTSVDEVMKGASNEYKEQVKEAVINSLKNDEDLKKKFAALIYLTTVAPHDTTISQNPGFWQTVWKISVICTRWVCNMTLIPLMFWDTYGISTELERRQDLEKQMSKTREEFKPIVEACIKQLAEKLMPDKNVSQESDSADNIPELQSPENHDESVKSVSSVEGDGTFAKNLEEARNQDKVTGPRSAA